MKSPSLRRKRESRSAPVRDAQVEEFERQDLGGDIRASGAARILRPRSKPTSILLAEDLIQALRKKGAKRGIGYQTMLKIIVREHVGEY